MFLLIHFEIQELLVKITTNTQTQPENFQEILQISKNNSSRFPGFPGVSDTLLNEPFTHIYFVSVSFHRHNSQPDN